MSRADALVDRIETAKGTRAKLSFSHACRLYGKLNRTLPELRFTRRHSSHVYNALGAELLRDIIPLLIDIVPNRDKKRAIGEHMDAIDSYNSCASPLLDAASASPQTQQRLKNTRHHHAQRGAFICQRYDRTSL